MAGNFSVGRFIEQYILPFIHHGFQILNAQECRITEKIKNKILLADDGKDIVDLMEEALCQDSLKDIRKAYAGAEVLRTCGAISRIQLF